MSQSQMREEEYEAIKQAEKETNDKNISRRLRICVIDRLCETIRNLNCEMVRNITSRQWIVDAFLE